MADGFGPLGACRPGGVHDRTRAAAPGCTAYRADRRPAWQRPFSPVPPPRFPHRGIPSSWKISYTCDCEGSNVTRSDPVAVLILTQNIFDIASDSGPGTVVFCYPKPTSPNPAVPLCILARELQPTSRAQGATRQRERREQETHRRNIHGNRGALEDPIGIIAIVVRRARQSGAWPLHREISDPEAVKLQRSVPPPATAGDSQIDCA